MELTDALRTTGSVRAFLDESVSDEVLYAILDDARFAPSGGNRQAWHVIVVKDSLRRRALRDLYLDGWHDYIAHVLAGLVPFSPLAPSRPVVLLIELRLLDHLLASVTDFALQRGRAKVPAAGRRFVGVGNRNQRDGHGAGHDEI